MRRALALFLAVAPFLPGCRCPTVDSGHRGIVFKTLGGGTSKELLGEGMQVIPIWNYIIEYDTRVHEMKEQLVVLSSNGLTIRVDTSVRFRPKPDELYELQTQIGPDYDQKVVAPIVRSGAGRSEGVRRLADIPFALSVGARSAPKSKGAPCVPRRVLRLRARCAGAT